MGSPGDVKGRPLGRFETAETLSGRHAPFNAVVIIGVSGMPDRETLSGALKVLQRRHPLLRCRILHPGRRFVFESGDAEDIPLFIRKRRYAGEWKSAAESELNTGFDIARAPLVRCLVLAPDVPDDDGEILLTFHHAIVDASSAVHLLHELLSLCRISMGGGEQDFDPLPLLPPGDQLYPRRFRGLSLGSRLARFVIRQMADEILFRWRNRGFPQPPVHPGARGRILSFDLSPRATSGLVRAGRARRITINSVLAAAILMGLMKHTPSDRRRRRHRHIGFADLRPYLKPPVSPENLGSYFSMIRCTIPFLPRDDFWTLAGRCHRLLTASVRSGDKFISPLLSAGMMKMIIRSGRMRMGATALSYSGAARIDDRYGSISVREIHGYVSNFDIGPEYTAAVRLYGGRLCWDILYLDKDMSEMEAKRIADGIRLELEAASKEPL